MKKKSKTPPPYVFPDPVVENFYQQMKAKEKSKGSFFSIMVIFLDIIMRAKIIFIIFPALVLLTNVVVYIICGKEYFQTFPWFRVSVALSLFTCLWPYTLKREPVLPSEIIGEGGVVAGIYAAFMVPFEFWMIYPRLENMVHGIGFLITLTLLHAIGFYAVYLARKTPPETAGSQQAICLDLKKTKEKWGRRTAVAFLRAEKRGPKAAAAFMTGIEEANMRISEGESVDTVFFDLLMDDLDGEVNS